MTQRPGSGRSDHHLRNVLVWWVVLSVLAEIGWLVAGPLLMPAAVSSDAVFANTTIVVFTALAIPVALFVWVFMAYSLIRFRVKSRPSEAGPHLVASNGQQIAWLGITGALCLFLVIWGLFGMYQASTDPPGRPLIVDVTAQQWTWTFRYPSAGVSSNQLVLPVGRPVEFEVTSLDVVHGFDVHAFSVRLDANPGSVIATNIVTPTRLGSFSVRCVELCGLYHAYMWAPVKVVSDQDFAAWLRDAAQGSRGGAGA